MTQPYLGEIRMFAGSFAPRGNSFAAGQILNITQNTALFSLFGTIYGGNGTVTFGLPDLRGRVAVGFQQGPGLSNYMLGQTGGSENVAITSNTMPMHNHTFNASSDTATSAQPGGNVPATLDAGYLGYYFTPGNDSNAPPNPFLATAISNVGGSQPHENRMPILAINYIVALQGIFPSRN
jgi:microcystin-dependent protein